MSTLRIPTTLLAALLCLPTAAQAARADDDVEWDGVYSDTTALFVNPMAPESGESVTIGVRTFANDITSARARVWYSGPNVESFVDLSEDISLPGSAFSTWSTTLQPPSGTSVAYWRFELTDGETTVYYDAGAYDDDPRYRGLSSDARGDDYNFQVVFDFDTPDWSKKAIWYQVFPERFYNGDTSNDLLDPDDSLWYLDWAPEGSNTGKDCEFHGDWDASPTGPCDFFGGDLNGVSAKLDYIDGLGVNALYLNPIFRSRSNHKYDTMDYTEVDPRFGGQDALDALSTSVGNRGWKVIVDGVFNHSSDQSIYYNAYPDLDEDPFYPESIGVWEDELLSQGSSQWDSWFKTWVSTDYYDVDRDGDLDEAALHTCGWFGFEFMPNFDFGFPGSNSDVRQWLYGGSSSEVGTVARNSIAGRWLVDGGEVSRGLDGWRLDVPDNAGYAVNGDDDDCSWVANDDTIWQGFRKAVKTANPDAYITGEIWRDATTNGGLNWFQNKTFDAVMNYHYFAMPLTCYLNGFGLHEAAGTSSTTECADDYAPMIKGSSGDLANLDAHLAQGRRRYPAPAYMANQNLISSHDTARWISREGASSGTLRNAFQFQATVAGAPMVYYGDEVGLQGGNDPDNRRTFPWDDVNGAAQQSLSEELSSLLCLRGTYDALSTGSSLTLDLDDTRDTYAFARFNGDDNIVVAINASDSSRTVRIPVTRLGYANGDELVDGLSGTEVVVASELATLTLGARDSMVLISSDRIALSDSCREQAVNNAPTADAGTNPSVFSTEDDIVLDGSGSFDPDGDSLNYLWTDANNGQVGSSATVTLPPHAEGSYIYTLTVSDGSLSDSAAVEVIVEGIGQCEGGCCKQELVATGATTRHGALPLLALIAPALIGLRLRRRR